MEASWAWEPALVVGRGRTVRSIITLGSGESTGTGGWVGVVQYWVWPVRKDEEVGLGEVSNGAPGPRWGVASNGSRGCWLVIGQQHHTGCIGWERRALSCGVVGFGRGGEGWGDRLEGRAGREDQKMGLGVARRGTGEDQCGWGCVLGWLVGGWSECFVPGPHQRWESCISVRGVEMGAKCDSGRGWPGLVSQQRAGAVGKGTQRLKMGPGIRNGQRGTGGSVSLPRVLRQGEEAHKWSGTMRWCQ